MEQNDNKKTIKTAFINTLANIISIMVGVITVPIIARILSTSDVGIVTTFTTTRNIAVMFFTGGIYFYINKALLKYNKDIKGWQRQACLYPGDTDRNVLWRNKQ